MLYVYKIYQDINLYTYYPLTSVVHLQVVNVFRGTGSSSFASTFDVEAKPRRCYASRRRWRELTTWQLFRQNIDLFVKMEERYQ